ncbi:MAG: sigma-70 family RNA polymerase sigma factor, partial [Bacteroidales bacterium]
LKLADERAAYFNPDNNDVIQQIENEELSLSISQAINELPDKCREVFRLSYLNEMKNKEIAEFMHISLRTVEAHMYKALKYLRGRLKENDLFVFFLIFFS